MSTGTDGRIDAWVSYGSAGRQSISRLGANYGLFSPSWGPIRFSAYLRGGFEHRRSDPKEGFGGFLGGGLEMGIWVHNNWQLAFEVNRNLGISTKSWTEAGFGVRFCSRRLWDAIRP